MQTGMNGVGEFHCASAICRQTRFPESFALLAALSASRRSPYFSPHIFHRSSVLLRWVHFTASNPFSWSLLKVSFWSSILGFCYD
jgi:hypothetical protein